MLDGVAAAIVAICMIVICISVLVTLVWYGLIVILHGNH